MKKILTVLLATLFVAGSLVVGGCGSDDITCSSAMSNIYGEGCAIFADGVQVSKSEAIEGCQSNQSMAGDCGCSGSFKTALKCLDGLSENCDSCDSVYGAWIDCMTSNCG